MLNSIGRLGLLDVSQPSRLHGQTELITMIVNPLSDCSTFVHPNVTKINAYLRTKSNNHKNGNNVNNYKSTVISIITRIKIIPARRATPGKAEVQVRQAAQPSERLRQGRRCSGKEASAPVDGWSIPMQCGAPQVGHCTFGNLLPLRTPSRDAEPCAMPVSCPQGG